VVAGTIKQTGVANGKGERKFLLFFRLWHFGKCCADYTEGTVGSDANYNAMIEIPQD
jgi:hypothetical protein